VKNILLAIVLGLSPAILSAQDLSGAVKAQAQRCATALVHADYETVVLCTHKRLVDARGGKSAIIATMKRNIDQMRSEGAKLESVTIGTPQTPLKVGSWIIAFVPQRMVVQVPDGKITADSHLLGISEDGGKKWTFADVGNTSDTEFANTWPELAGKITLPARNPPQRERIGTPKKAPAASAATSPGGNSARQP
jgi:hypothetical protein